MTAREGLLPTARALTLAFLALTAMVLALTGAPTRAHAASVDTQSIYRFYDPVHGIRKYTTNAVEILNYKQAGWISEGVVWTAPVTSDSPVYTLTDSTMPSKVRYTRSRTEYVNMGRQGWQRTGTAWYSAPSTSSIRVFQLQTNLTGEPFLTTSREEYSQLNSQSAGYTGLGTLCYGATDDSRSELQDAGSGGVVIEPQTSPGGTVEENPDTLSDPTIGKGRKTGAYQTLTEFGHYEDVPTTTTKTTKVLSTKHIAAGCGMEFGYYGGRNRETGERLPGGIRSKQGDLIDWDYNQREVARYNAHVDSLYAANRAAKLDPNADLSGFECKTMDYLQKHPDEDSGGAWVDTSWKATQTITLTEKRWVKDFSCYADANGNHNPNCPEPSHHLASDPTAKA